MSALPRVTFFFVVILTCRLCLAGENLSTSRFGEIRIFGNREKAASFVMLLSDSGGWDPGAEAFAEALAVRGAIVAGIDVLSYLENLVEDDEDCHYLAGEFERLAQVIQQNIGMKHYYRPLLAGYREGGALVYAILAEGPQSIDGGLSKGFCPSLHLDHPLCGEDEKISEPVTKEGTVRLLPVKKMGTPWLVESLKGDVRCDSEAGRRFISQIGNVEFVDGPVAVEKLLSLAKAPKVPSNISTNDLPLIELPAERKEEPYFAIFISGDGGWASIDKEIGDVLARNGISVVGVDALRYFWKKRTPAEAGRDLERIIKDYLEGWSRDQVVLLGYSLGADVLPPMFNNLSGEIKAKVRRIILLNAAPFTDMQVHLTDWIGLETDRGGIPLLPELARIGPDRLFCIYGLDDDETVCRGLSPSIGRAQGLEGSHHFDGDYEKVAGLILKEL